MDDVKKRLKTLLRPGESEKRPELTWPKSMKKEPVEVVKVQCSCAFYFVLRADSILGGHPTFERVPRHHEKELG